jgi:hypothetical protein
MIRDLRTGAAALVRTCAAALVGATLAACGSVATTPGGDGAAKIAGADAPAVSVREHLSGRYLALIGPKVQHDPPYLDTPETNYFCLRSLIDRQTGETANQLYVTASYDTERDWSAAHDGTGQALEFIPISRYPIACDKKDSCSYAEEFAANIPLGELRAGSNGFSVTFTDAAGDAQAISVSGEQVAAQLAALAQHQKDATPASPASVRP